MLISMICFAAQKTIEIVCAFQIGYRLNAWVYIHLSHSGCEVVVKAKDLCYIQRKVDINDAGFKFNNIWKAHKNIWRPNLLVIIGRGIATTINLFHGSKKIYVVVTCTLHHGFIIIIIFLFLFWQLIEW